MVASHSGTTICVTEVSPVPSSRLAVFEDFISSTLSESAYMLVDG